MKELNRFRQFLTEGVIKENKYDIDDPNSPLSQLNDNDQDVAILNNMTKKYGKDVVLMWMSSGEYGGREYFEEGVIKEEDIAEMAYERDSVEDIVKRIKPILANHPQLKKQEDPEQYLIDFVTKRKRFINKNEAPIGKDKFAYNVGTMPYDKYINLQFNKYIYSTLP